MRKLSFVALVALLFGGCASIPKTTTYQTTEWREVEEAQPATTIILQEQEIKEDPQSSKVVIEQLGIPARFPGRVKGRNYLNIGFNPVNPNRALTEEEVEFILPADTYVKTIDRDGRTSKGWLLAGKRVIGVPTDNPNYYKASWIRECGNPIFEEQNLILFKVRKTLPQPSLRTREPAQVRREVVQQPPVKRWVPVTVEKTRELTCRERKAQVSWWRKGLSYVVTGATGAGGAFLGAAVSHSPHGAQVGAGLGVAVGRLVGGYTDGTECIDGGDVAEAVVLGVTAGLITPTSAPKARPAGSSTHPGGPAPPPPNGPPIPTRSGGPAPLPPNGPAYYNGGAPLAPSGGPSFLPWN